MKVGKLSYPLTVDTTGFNIHMETPKMDYQQKFAKLRELCSDPSGPFYDTPIVPLVGDIMDDFESLVKLARDVLAIEGLDAVPSVYFYDKVRDLVKRIDGG